MARSTEREQTVLVSIELAEVRSSLRTTLAVIPPDDSARNHVAAVLARLDQTQEDLDRALFGLFPRA